MLNATNPLSGCRPILAILWIGPWIAWVAMMNVEGRSVPGGSETTPKQLSGTLEAGVDSPPVLLLEDRSVPLASPRPELEATLRDKAISGRRLEVHGRMRADGVFEVSEFYIVRDDGRYRLIYYCDT